MNKEEVIEYLKKELEHCKDYVYISLDDRFDKPRLFQAWAKEDD